CFFSSFSLPMFPSFPLFPYTTLFRSPRLASRFFPELAGSLMVSNQRMDQLLDFLHRLRDVKELIAWGGYVGLTAIVFAETGLLVDRKSTRLNSSHGSISYAVFCLKKK